MESPVFLTLFLDTGTRPSAVKTGEIPEERNNLNWKVLNEMKKKVNRSLEEGKIVGRLARSLESCLQIV